MKKLVLLVFALNICLGTFAQFTPGDTLKYPYQSERQSGYGLLFAKA